MVRFLLQQIGFVENCEGSLIPLVPEGLKGVIFSPLLHGNLEHIASNSVPIAALLFLLYQFYPKLANPVFLRMDCYRTCSLVIATYEFFREEATYTCIIGRSGIVYMLAFFLFFSGILEKTKTAYCFSFSRLVLRKFNMGNFSRRIILSIRRTELNFLASSPFWSCSWPFFGADFRKNIKKKKKKIHLGIPELLQRKRR